MKIAEFIKKEAVLSIAFVLAVVSAFVIVPDREYISYIDFRTLAILFSLMLVMAGLKSVGVFEYFACKTLSLVRGQRSLAFVLTSLCFFSSMLVTNDVALITFVPFSLIVLKRADKEKMAVPVVSMQTVAANLGSMLTPIGNPQNLYLYAKSGMGLVEFVLLMLPYTLVAFVLILIWCMLQKNPQISVSGGYNGKIPVKQTLVYAVLFAVCLLCVAKIINFWICAVIVGTVCLMINRRIFKEVDYSLLLTFAAFFIFIGNMGRIDVINDFLKRAISGNEVVSSVLVSQVISNVPAALLLSGFTDNIKELIVGVNLGGLGTLIASMASLISYKYIAREYSDKKGKYLIYFTAVNLIFLAALLII